MSQLLVYQEPTAHHLLELFIQDCRDRQLTEETIRRYRSTVQHYLSYLDRREVSPLKVDKHVLHDYVRQRRMEGVDQKTLENELSPRKLVSVEEMSLLVNSVLDTRDKAILTLLAKTGVRRGELIAMDVTDVNWADQSITLKRRQFKKRSNRLVFFDDEAARLLRRWLGQRAKLDPRTTAIFIGEHGERLKRNGVYSMVVKYAERAGLHDSKSPRPEDHFSPHCFRHWFTTHLRRAGMDREFIKALRGDRRREAIDIYDRIDPEELRTAYVAFIPQLGI